jgi:hypothetical protein
VRDRMLYEDPKPQRFRTQSGVVAGRFATAVHRSRGLPLFSFHVIPRDLRYRNADRFLRELVTFSWADTGTKSSLVVLPRQSRGKGTAPRPSITGLSGGP